MAALVDSEIDVAPSDLQVTYSQFEKGVEMGEPVRCSKLTPLPPESQKSESQNGDGLQAVLGRLFLTKSGHGTTLGRPSQGSRVPTFYKGHDAGFDTDPSS